MTDSPLVPVTTYAFRLLHLAPENRMTAAPTGPGRTGRTLCRQDGLDQERCTYIRERNGGRKPLNIATLPACKKCAHAANH